MPDGWLNLRMAATLLTASVGLTLPVPEAFAQSSARVERPSGLELHRRGLDSGDIVRDTRLGGITFSAFGRQYEIALQDNDRIKGGLTHERIRRLAGVHLYGGTLNGYSDSWVRLTQSADRVAGVIWDGLDLLAVEIDGDESRIYHTDELRSALGIDFGKDFLLAAGAAQSTPWATVATTDAANPLVSPGRTIDIGVVADSTLAAAHGPNVEEDLLTIMNVVDGIFLWQVGVQIRIAEIVLLEETGDPFISVSTEPGPFLDAVSGFKVDTPALTPLGLVHLFTGRDIVDNRPDIDPVGVAKLGVVCDSANSVGITEFDGADGLVTEWLIAVHELGHNFGAPHDGEEGSACAATPTGFIMERVLNGSETFSQCSLEQMQPFVLGASCLIEWPPNDLSLRYVNGSDVVQSQGGGFLQVAIDRAESSTENTVELLIEATGAVELGPGFPRLEPRAGFECLNLQYCRTSYLSTPAELVVGFRGTGAGTGEIIVTVRGSNDPNPDNDVLVHAVTVSPAVDLMSTLELLPDQLEIDGEMVARPSTVLRLTATVTNLSMYPATNAIADFRFDGASTEYVASMAGVSCRHNFLPIWIICEIGTLNAGEQRSLDVSFRTRTNPPEFGTSADSLRMIASADEYDPVFGNDEAAISVWVARDIFDIETSITKPGPVAVGEQGSIVITTQNLGPDPVPALRLRTESVPGPEAFDIDFSVSTSHGSCAFEGLLHELACDYGVVEPDTAVETVISFAGSQTGEFSALVFWNSPGHELDHWLGVGRSFEIVVVDPVPPPEPEPDPAPDPGPSPDPSPTPMATPTPAPQAGSSGGGGGSLDWISVLLLLLAHAARVSGHLRHYRRNRRSLEHVTAR